MINRDQLLEELWAAYPDTIFDVVDVTAGMLAINTRGPWTDTKDIVGKHVPDPDWGKTSDPDVPEDIPIREKGTGKLYHLSVENGAVKLYPTSSGVVEIE